jgi:hypothetical protein
MAEKKPFPPLLVPVLAQGKEEADKRVKKIVEIAVMKALELLSQKDQQSGTV